MQRWLILVFAFGCADFDLQEQIEDLRILAIKTEPAEIQYAASYALLGPSDRPPGFPLPSYHTDVEVLAFDPRGGAMSSKVQLCPQGNGACENFDIAAVQEREPMAGAADIAAAFTPTEKDFVLEASAGGLIGGLGRRFDLGPGAIDALIPDSGGRPSPQFFPLLPRIAAEIRNNDIAPVQEDGGRAVFREIAFKRIPVGIDFRDPTLPPEFLDAFGTILGVDFCTESVADEDFVEGPADCFDPRPPNRNPLLRGFALLTGDDIDPPEGESRPLDLGPKNGLLQVASGSQLRLLPILNDDVRERYQVLTFDIETSELNVENRFEDIVINWYFTRGAIEDATSEFQFKQTLANRWSLPQQVASGEQDVVVVVVRDQRGGVDFGMVTVEYR